MQETQIKNIIHLNMIKGENDLNERIEQCQTEANKIAFGELETDQDLFNRMRFIVSRHYNIPYFSEIFDNLVLDQILFEVCLLNAKEKPVPQADEYIRENLDEAAALFDDFDEVVNKNQLSEQDKKSIEEDMKAFKEGGFAGVINKNKKQTEGEEK